MNIAETLMMEFAENTGLSSNNLKKRYLWTDAFAVCNFIQLSKLTNNDFYKILAIDLVDQVHNTLGKFREDNHRKGWLSSKQHPTRNGLRIGKPLPERKSDEPIDKQLEWERDGQYFHYLTKWMLALIRMGEFCGESKYILWAVDLLEASRAFIHGNRMYWKMSIDLSRPLISSMGQHDPLNGYVTYKVVNMHTERDLGRQINQIRKLAENSRFATADPLGIGGLLVDAYRLHEMNEDSNLISNILNAAEYGLQYSNVNVHSLAFRELGLAIGLEASRRMKKLDSYWSWKEKLIEYWINHRKWSEHKNINQVMLATSLIPDEFLMV